jgi:beta-lactamase class A
VRLLCLLISLPLFAASPLDSELARIAEASGGTVGIAALHLESGKTFEMRAKERFPMASVFKLPLAMTILDRNGPGPLEVRMKLEASDVRPFRSPIAERAPRGGIVLTLEELVDATIVESDNTAADVLLRLLPGAGVNGYLRKLGIDGMRVDRSEGQMALDYAGVTDPRPESEWTLDWFKQAISAVPPIRQREAAQRALADNRDTTTPDAALKLLQLFVQGKALPKDHTDFLLDRMRKTVPAAARIKAGLPSGTAVAHRPGTGGDNEGVNLCTNDIGIATLPNGNHLLLCVFLKGSNKDLAAREQTIAQITKTIFDAWTH